MTVPQGSALLRPLHQHADNGVPVTRVFVAMALATAWTMLPCHSWASDRTDAHKQEDRASTKRLPDYSHPKNTLRVFCLALQTGDIETLKDCAIRASAKTVRLRDATIHHTVAQHRFRKAACGKFGHDRLWSDDVAIWLEGTKDAEVLQMDGKKAMLRVKKDGTTCNFRKEGDKWKLDLIDLGDEIERMKPAVLERTGRELEEDSKSYDRLTKQIENGKLKTAEDVKRAIGEAFIPRGFPPD
jgi:hypothetical protein